MAAAGAAVEEGSAMTTEGGRLAWQRRYLRELAGAGDNGIAEREWRQAKQTPANLNRLVGQGLVKMVERIEPVRYYVLTDAGREAVKEIGPGADASRGGAMTGRVKLFHGDVK